MSDPPRLLSDESNDFERALLRSWEGEQPSAEARARALAVAGMGAATVAAAIKGAGGASLAPKAAVGAGAALKWVGLGALVVAVGGAALYVRHASTTGSGSTTARSSDALVVVAAPSTTPVVPAASAGPTSSAATEASSPAPAVVDRPAPATHAPPRASAPRAASTLGDQVTALDHARRALADGDPRGALRLVEDYESRFPRGALSEEAEVVRIEALVATGDHAGAGRAASRFLAAHPASPHASHVRALVGEP